MTESKHFEELVGSLEPTLGDKLAFAAVAIFIVIPIASSMLLVQYLTSVLSNLRSSDNDAE